jgi:hypothetical protein
MASAHIKQQADNSKKAYESEMLEMYRQAKAPKKQKN